MAYRHKFKWIKEYLDPESEGYLDRAKSAEMAGYKCKSKHSYNVIGCRLAKYFNKSISAHREKLLDPEWITNKFKDLAQAKKTVFFQKDGIVTEAREVEALDIQHKAVAEMAKIAALYDKDNKSKAPVIQIINYSEDNK